MKVQSGEFFLTYSLSTVLDARDLNLSSCATTMRFFFYKRIHNLIDVSLIISKVATVFIAS